MATIKTDRVDYEKLLNGLDPIATPQPTVAAPPVPTLPTTVATTIPTSTQQAIDNVSAAEMMNVKAFDFDYDAIRKGIRKKARKTILGIVKHIIPMDLIEEEYVQDKIEQDIEIMTGLYMQVETNTIMQRSLMEDVAHGNKMPRMYEVFAQLTDKLQSVNKQIVETEQKIRKTYLDLKFEIRDKANEDMAAGFDNTNAIGPSQQANGGFLVTSTKDLIANAKRIHADKVKSDKEQNDKLNDAQETKFTETE